MKAYLRTAVLLLSSLISWNSWAYIPLHYALEEQKQETDIPGCKGQIAPRVIIVLNDYEIIASNVASIPAAPAFTGSNLSYAVSAKPGESANKVSIDTKTGEIKIKAETRDNFDVTVSARNACGSTSTTFNVVIDEEE